LRRIALTVLPLLLIACTEDPARPDPDVGPGSDAKVDSSQGSDAKADAATVGKAEMVITDDLLTVLEVRFLKGRCLGRLSINSKDTEARAAIIAFAKAVSDTVPLDGSKPKTDAELKGLIPGSGAQTGWTEDPTDGVTGPWLITTDAFDWINGSGKPFDDNGFEAAVGEYYTNSAKSWKLELTLVNQGTPAGAEAANRHAQWDQGKAP
jgi:hypothetical protein